MNTKDILSPQFGDTIKRISAQMKSDGQLSKDLQKSIKTKNTKELSRIEKDILSNLRGIGGIHIDRAKYILNEVIPDLESNFGINYILKKTEPVFKKYFPNLKDLVEVDSWESYPWWKLHKRDKNEST